MDYDGIHKKQLLSVLNARFNYLDVTKTRHNSAVNASVLDILKTKTCEQDDTFCDPTRNCTYLK